MSEDKDFFIRAKTDSPLPEDDTFTKQDPFNQTWDVVKDLQGLDANFRGIPSSRETSSAEESLDFLWANIRPLIRTSWPTGL